MRRRVTIQRPDSTLNKREYESSALIQLTRVTSNSNYSWLVGEVFVGIYLSFSDLD